jgi:hypothetical protein
VASRFGVVLSQKFAAQALPVVGALGGASVNYVFIEHSHAHGLKAVATPTSTAGGANAFEIIHRDHAAFAIYQTSRTGTSTAENPHVAENKLAYR